MAKPNLSRDGSDEDFILNGETVWIQVKGVAVYIRKTDEGVSVDLYKAGDEMADSLASAYVFDNEVSDEE